MKLALNGALTIGPLDGANVEIREAVGPENFFLFGLSTEEIAERRRNGYDPRQCTDGTPGVKEVLKNVIGSGVLGPEEPSRFAPVIHALLDQGDQYMLHSEAFPAYVECQERVEATYRSEETWTRMSILNVARMGRFSSDRTVRAYAEEIWGAKSVPCGEGREEGIAPNESSRPSPHFSRCADARTVL